MGESFPLSRRELLHGGWLGLGAAVSHACAPLSGYVCWGLCFFLGCLMRLRVSSAAPQHGKVFVDELCLVSR